MRVWPSTLHASPLVSGYTEEMQDNAERFKPEVGKPKGRPRFTESYDEIDCTVHLSSREEVRILRSFFKVDCAEGTLSFTWYDHVLEETLSFLWREPPSIKAVAGDIFRAQLKLVRMPYNGTEGE